MVLESLGRAWGEARRGAAPPGAREPVSFRALVILLAGAAFVIRALLAHEGLPYLHSWDEPFIVSKSLDMMKKGELNPSFFVYGSLPIYMDMGVSVVHYLWLMGRPETDPPFLSHLDQIVTYHDTGWLWEVSHPSFFLWARWLAAVFGAGTAVIAYLIARRIAGRWAGILAALFLAGQAFHAQHSSIATVDNPMTFFALLAAWGAVAFLESRHPGHLLLALSACGLAASCKYTAALAVVMPLAALLFTMRALTPALRRLCWAGLPVVPLAAFLAGSPFALLNLRAFLIDFGKTVRVYGAEAWVLSKVNPGLEHAAYQAGRIYHQAGLVPVLLMVAGLAVLASRRTGMIVLVYGALHAIAVCSTQLSYPRNFLVLYPILAVAFGAGAVLAVGAARALSGRTGRHGRRAPAAAALVVTAFPLYAGSATARTALEAYRKPETRSATAERLAEIAGRQEDSRIAIPEELKMHPDDLRRLGNRYVEAPWVDLLCGEAGWTHAAIPVRWSAYAERRRAWSDILNRLAPGNAVETWRSKGVAPMLIDAPSQNPQIEIVAIAAEAPEAGSPCLGRFLPGDLSGSEAWIVDKSGDLAMGPGSRARTEWLIAEAGPHAVVVEAWGGRGGGGGGRLRIRALSRGGDGGVVTLAEREADLARDRDPHGLVFDVPADGVLAAEFESAGAAGSPDPKSDHNVHVSKVYVLRLAEAQEPET